MDNISIITGIFVLSTLIEGTVTYLFGDTNLYRPWLKYISLTLGVGASVAYGIDILAMFGLVSPYALVGQVVSGLIIGRGANYLNDILDRLKAK